MLDDALLGVPASGTQFALGSGGVSGSGELCAVLADTALLGCLVGSVLELHGFPSLMV